MGGLGLSCVVVLVWKGEPFDEESGSCGLAHVH